MEVVAIGVEGQIVRVGRGRGEPEQRAKVDRLPRPARMEGRYVGDLILDREGTQVFEAEPQGMFHRTVYK